MKQTHNINVAGVVPLIAPRELKQTLPMTETANETVLRGRETVQRILNGQDPRLLVIVGPCSIHDERAALDYCQRLCEVAKQVEDQLLVMMRVYFEKPRTTIGWKGLINDPHLNGTFDIAAGLFKAREILLRVTEMGMPAATEMLDPITPQYTADLVSWASIGARTTESQTHRQMASGLSMPVGYKNATDGNLQIAFDALMAAGHSHNFLGIDQEGRTCIIQTKGNPYGHLILRGGRSGPNFAPEMVCEASERLRSAKLFPQVMVDCSHANSDKDHKKQAVAWQSVVQQRLIPDNPILGLMLESNLVEGSQKLPSDLSTLTYGQSITDACLGWSDTSDLLHSAHDILERHALATQRT